jgi:hypothetical protein
MKSVAISSRTMDLSEAGHATASLRDETVDAVVSIAVLQLIPDPLAALAADVPARVSCTVEWRLSSRTTEGLPSGASVAGSGRGLEVPAEIRWVGMNSRICRHAQRTFCGWCQFDTLTRTPVGGESRLGREILPPRERHGWRALQSSPPSSEA